MAISTHYNEIIPQVVITPNRNAQRGLGNQETVGRILPHDVQQRATTLGKAATEEGGETGFWGRDGFTFGDLIDLINPLQHIPVVSTIYRAITGDEIGIGPRLLGGAVLGGVVGFGLSAINAALEYETGKDVGDHALMAMGLATEEEVSVASEKTVDPRKFLSSVDPTGMMLQEMPEIASAPAQAAQALTQEQQAIVNMAQAGASQTELKVPSGAGSDPRMVYTLGGMSAATERYQQTQMMDKLQSLALGMDIEG